MADIVVGIIIQNGKALMLERMEGGWTFPSGKVEFGEIKEEAVEREVMEETGLSVSVSRRLGERCHPQTGKQMSYWLCDIVSGIAENRESDKHRSLEWLTRQQVLAVTDGHLFEPVDQILSLRSQRAYSTWRLHLDY